jgi:UDP:flavonoid glycosyltransferase YjiC (YdhE family)
MAAVGAELRSRGHEVIFFQIPDFAKLVDEIGLEFHVVGDREFPPGSIKRLDEVLGRLDGIDGLRYSLKRSVDQSKLFLEVLPTALHEERIDFLVIDDVELYGFTVAEFMGLPYATLSMALPVAIDESVPPYFTNWSYRADAIGRFRNRLGYRAYLRLARPLATLVDAYRLMWKLPPRTSRESRRRRLASISQLPRCLDFPRVALSRFYYTAPFGLKLPREAIQFPWHRLDGRPIVYASFGTVMSRPDELKMIAKASNDLGYQAVIACGGARRSDVTTPDGSNAVVIDRAPQLDLLSRASVIVTHGGLNTALEALAFGVPLLAIPFVNDQAGVAARLQWKGVADVLRPHSVTHSNLTRALSRLVGKHEYRDCAQRLSEQIQTIDGARKAAEIIELVAQKCSKPSETNRQENQVRGNYSAIL